jgi:hypothetical protein
VRRLQDGGYVVAGAVHTPVWNDSLCLMRTDSSGDTVWTRSISGSWAEAMDLTLDGGYIVVSNHGDSVLVIRTDDDGNTIWERRVTDDTFGDAYARAVRRTPDGAYMLAASAAHDGMGFPPPHAVWLAKLGEGGGVIWQRYFDYQYAGDPADVETSDGSVTVLADCGYPYSSMRGVACLARFTNDGTLLWKRLIGDPYDFFGRGIVATDDGGFVIAGYGPDAVLIKVDENGFFRR